MSSEMPIILKVALSHDAEEGFLCYHLAVCLFPFLGQHPEMCLTGNNYLTRRLFSTKNALVCTHGLTPVPDSYSGTPRPKPTLLDDTPVFPAWPCWFLVVMGGRNLSGRCPCGYGGCCGCATFPAFGCCALYPPGLFPCITTDGCDAVVCTNCPPGPELALVVLR